jgi:putative acetyltransferase
MLRIVQAASEADYGQVQALIAEYVAWDSARTRQLGLNIQTLLEFQYSHGTEELPGVYTSPEGCLLLASYGAEIAGCGAFRKLNADTCEMKRLYVRPGFRGKEIGRSLASTLIKTARQVGYMTMCLETVTFMTGALTLYSSLGFKVGEPYYLIPEEFREITVFLELDLRGEE